MAKKKLISPIFLDHIQVPVFKQKINLVFAKDGPYGAMRELEQLQQFADCFHSGNVNHASEYLQDSNAMVVRVLDKLYIILPFDATHGVIAHEIYHLVKLILNHRGVKYCEESEEAYAYLIDWLTDEIYDYRDSLLKKLAKEKKK